MKIDFKFKIGDMVIDRWKKHGIVLSCVWKHHKLYEVNFGLGKTFRIDEEFLSLNKSARLIKGA